MPGPLQVVHAAEIQVSKAVSEMHERAAYIQMLETDVGERPGPHAADQMAPQLSVCTLQG